MKKTLFAIFYVIPILLTACQSGKNTEKNINPTEAAGGQISIDRIEDISADTAPTGGAPGQETTESAAKTPDKVNSTDSEKDSAENTKPETVPDGKNQTDAGTPDGKNQTNAGTPDSKNQTNADNTAIDKTNNNTTTADTTAVDISGFQKEMNIVSLLRLPTVCKTENGYYLQNEGLLYFMDTSSNQMIVVCGKPECAHNDVDCNAWINSRLLSYYNGKLYYCNSDAISDSMKTLWSMELDGTNHTKLQRLQTKKHTDWMVPQYIYQPVIANGYVYYIEQNTMLYKNRLGADISDAVLLVDEDTSKKLESTWKFWPDNGNVYAMNHFMGSDGQYYDVLYLLGESRTDTKEIWSSSKLADFAAPDTYWYLAGEHLYYYVSGEDLWDIDLNTGKGGKILKLSEHIKSGQALFTGRNLVLLDLGNRMIYVYDYDGALQNEISLSPIYGEYSDIGSCDLVFADGGSIYMLAYHGGYYMSASSSLYRIDWEKGNVQEIDTWPASKRKLPNDGPDQEHIIRIGD